MTMFGTIAREKNERGHTMSEQERIELCRRMEALSSEGKDRMLALMRELVKEEGKEKK